MPPVTPATLASALLTAAFASAVAVYALRRKAVRGARSFAALMGGVALWALGAAAAATRQDLPSALLWFNAGQTAAVFTPALWLVLTLAYTGRTRWLQPRRLALVFAGPAAAALLLWTDWAHHLLRGPVTLERHGSLTYIAFAGGPLRGPVFLYLLLLAFLSVPLLADALIRRPFKAQPLALLIAVLLPVGYFGLHLLGVIPNRPVGPGVMSVPLAALVMAWALFRGGLLDIAPVARDWVIESMPDAVLVLDARERIVDLNAAACALLDLARPAALGRPAAQALAAWPALAALSDNAPGGAAEMALPGPGGPRSLDVQVSELHDGGNRLAGRVLVLRDVTARRQAEQGLAAANAQLRVQLQRVHELQDRLREEAIRDALTGLFNRRYMQEALESELARARRSLQPLSLILLDIDEFKSLNDSRGHEAGDLMLQGLARLIQDHVRTGDVACRYGGEEFVLVLPGASLENCARRAEELRAAAAAYRLEREPDPLAATLSIGVAAFPEHGASAADLLRAADQALYTAKALGRNRLVVQPVHARGAPPGLHTPDSPR